MTYRALICGVVLVLPACGSDGDETVDSLDTSETGTDTDPAPTSSDGGDASTSSDATDPDSSEGSTSSDGSSGSDTGRPTAGPTAAEDIYYVPQGSELQIDAVAGVLANDTHPDGSALTVTTSDAASEADGIVSVSPDGHFTYDPVPNHWGPDSFAYTIADDDGDTATGLVTIIVTPVRIELEDVLDGVGGFALDGEESYDQSAIVVAGGGDVDDDGVSDVLVSAANFGSSQGRGYVVFGGAEPETTELSAIAAGMGGMALTGIGDVGHLSTALDGAGDVDGDGIEDILLGAQLMGYMGGGYVLFGAPGLAPLSTATIDAGSGGFAIDGTIDDEHVGASGSGVGDVNGDGFADVALGTDVYTFGNDNPDRVYVVLGKPDTSHVDLDDVTAGIGGFVIVGETHNDAIHVSSAGDRDGDGLGDLLIGALYSHAAGEEAGRAYVVFGKEDTDPVLLADIVDGVGGFAIDGESPNDLFGWPVNYAGDVNGDTSPDIVIGANGGPNGSGRGRSYVVLGTGNRVPFTAGDIVAGIGGFVLDGDVSHDGAASIAGSGDVNGDGLDDLIIGASGFSVSTPIHVVFGKEDTNAVDLADVGDGIGGYTIEPEPGYGNFTSVDGAGDFDGDGVGDLIVGVPDMLDSAGRSYVVYGVRTQP